MKNVKLLFLTLSVLGILALPQRAEACCSCHETVINASMINWLGMGNQSTFFRIIDHVFSELAAQRIWWGTILWEDNILPAMMLMAEQFTVVAMQQTQIYGTFLDAKHQMETQQLLQKIRVQAHKDYHPSTGMCEFGSTVKSLAASERKAEYNAIILSQRSQDRALGNANTAAATGPSGDRKSRIEQFSDTYCDSRDNNNGLGLLCSDIDTIGTTQEQRMQRRLRSNKDIDFVRTLEVPWSLEVDFTDNDLKDDEEDIMALANNLYGHQAFLRIPPASLQHTGNNLNPMQRAYMDMRSILAKRSVAENSFNSIVAMKSEGAPGSKDFLKAVLKELGFDGGPDEDCIDGVTDGVSCDPNDIIGPFGGDETQDIQRLLGDNPSYYAQMEILTKKIFQNPDFYTNLYDKPANVERKGVALQAIGLMQKFDLFKSYLRSEANLSVLLELAVSDLQDEVENQISKGKNASGTIN